MKLNKNLIAAAFAFVLAGAGSAAAQCDGSADIESNAMIDAGWGNLSDGDFDGLIAKLAEAGVINPTLENGLRSVAQQRPDGFGQCTVVLRNRVSDRLIKEYVVFSDEGSLAIFASMTVLTIDGQDRIFGFQLDSSLDPVVYNN